MLKLVDGYIVGSGEHRAGWPCCREALQELHSDTGILLDDFCERTFLYDQRQRIHTEPWVGILHHPPDMPDWYKPEMHIQNLLTNIAWQASLPNLRALMTLGPALTDWCRETWPEIPCHTLKHPTGAPMCTWNPDAFLDAQTGRQLLQVGWFLRNTWAIYQIPPLPFLRRSCILPQSQGAKEMHQLLWHTQAQKRPIYADHLQYHGICSATDYDLHLAGSVVLMEVYSAVANNTVIECLVRNTPLCINRHPGPEFYLGTDYPLFYEDFREIPKLLTTPRILDAYEYLKNLPKHDLTLSYFRDHVAAVLPRIME